MANSAAVQGNQVYGPYGNSRYSQGAMGTNKGFTGQYADATGLDYYNARYYDPVVGQFLSADVKQGDLQGMNPYGYVGGNPETLTDPTGQRFISSDGSQTGPIGNPTAPVTGGGSETAHSATCDFGTGICYPQRGKAPVGQPQPRQKQATGGVHGGTCNPDASNSSDHCVAWARKQADPARKEKTDAITHKADLEMLAGYLLFLTGDALNFFKGGIFDKVDAVLDFLATVFNSVVPLVGHIFGNSGFYQAALRFSSWGQSVMSAIQIAVGAVSSAQGWMKNTTEFTLNLLLASATGPAGIFMQGLMMLVKPMVGYLLDSGGHYLQSLAFADYAEAERQNNMPIQDWCIQYGCPAYTPET